MASLAVSVLRYYSNAAQPSTTRFLQDRDSDSHRSADWSQREVHSLCVLVANKRVMFRLRLWRDVEKERK